MDTACGDDPIKRLTKQPLSRRQLVRAGLASMPLIPLIRTPRLASAQAGTAVPAAGTFAGRVAIGSRSLWLESQGSGGPTVILDCGYRNDADVWDTVALDPGVNGPAVLPGVAAFARVAAYDRPGTFLDLDHRSRSDPVPMPRTAKAVVADLHALLGAAGIPAPYVLVGHSLGGLFARLYTATYPDEVVGMVQVDPFTEDIWPRFKAVLTPTEWAAIDALNRAVPPDLVQAYPDVEVVDFDASSAQMRAADAASPLRPMPLVVLRHGRSFAADVSPDALPPGFPWDKLEQEITAEYTKLASSVPGGRLVVARKSGHYVQLEQPELVVDEIRQVVEAVRHPGTWTGPKATPAASS